MTEEVIEVPVDPYGKTELFTGGPTSISHNAYAVAIQETLAFHSIDTTNCDEDKAREEVTRVMKEKGETEAVILRITIETYPLIPTE